MPETYYGVCNFCDSICGLEIEYEGGRILAVRGDKQNRFSRGHLCPKGFAQQDLYEDPDRLRAPLRRRGGAWEPISWEEAYGEAGSRLAAIQKQYGNDAVAVYYGNPVGHDYAALLCLLPFLKGMKTRNVYSATSVDSLTRMLVSLWLYGNQALLPIPDIERTNYLLILGANPAISQGSVMTAPDCRNRLLEIRRRGGRIVVVDPRRTETAVLASAHYFIRPATDALFLLAFLHTLFHEGRVQPGKLADRLTGLRELQQCAERFPPSRVAAVTGMGAEQIQTLAREFAEQSAAVCYGRMGTSTQEFGALATWLIDAVNIVTGNLDRPGGAMFNTPAADLPGLARLLRQPGFFNRRQSRVSRLPEFNGEFPVAGLAEEMETPGPGQIKALVTLAGNPALSLPNGRRLERAMANLEYMVSIDFYLNETTRHAHLILPPVSSLESDHYSLLEHAMGIRNTAHYAPALFPKPAWSKHNWEILLDLLRSLERHRGLFRRLSGRLTWSALHWFSPPRQLDLLLRLGSHKLSLARLKQHPHGLDLGPLEPRLDKALNTPDRRLHLAPPALINDLSRLEEKFFGAEKENPRLLLVSRRTLRSLNSWMHNSYRLVKGKNPCALLMNPKDAQERELREGDEVRLVSRVGEIMVPLSVTSEMMPGVVSMTYGWGHDREGVRLSVATGNPGVSMNDITDDSLFDRLSGISVLNGIPVTVSPGRSKTV